MSELQRLYEKAQADTIKDNRTAELNTHYMKLTLVRDVRHSRFRAKKMIVNFWLAE